VVPGQHGDPQPGEQHDQGQGTSDLAQLAGVPEDRLGQRDGEPLDPADALFIERVDVGVELGPLTVGLRVVQQRAGHALVVLQVLTQRRCSGPVRRTGERRYVAAGGLPAVDQRAAVGDGVVEVSVHVLLGIDGLVVTQDLEYAHARFGEVQLYFLGDTGQRDITLKRRHIVARQPQNSAREDHRGQDQRDLDHGQQPPPRRRGVLVTTLPAGAGVFRHA
jgi:hypothetical protein